MAQNAPFFCAGKGMKPMSSGSVPAFLAASRICVIAQEPSCMVAISPLAIRVLELSQFVVVGSFSASPSWTMSYRSESMTFSSLPCFHGETGPASRSLAFASQVTEPTLLLQAVSGQPSLKLV